MDLVDLIAEKRFLGQEFLTWLWFKSDTRGGAVEVPGYGDIQLVFGKHMLLEYGEGESHQKIICQGLQSELNEARTGLRMGKKLEQARVSLVQGDYEWNLTLKGSMLELRSVKPPKSIDSADESDALAAVEGRILEKMGMYEMVARTIDDLFRVFLKLRISLSAWEAEVATIQAWVRKER